MELKVEAAYYLFGISDSVSVGEKVETKNEPLLGCISGSPGPSAGTRHAEVLLGRLPGDTSAGE